MNPKGVPRAVTALTEREGLSISAGIAKKNG